jgi:hypothetical protein
MGRRLFQRVLLPERLLVHLELELDLRLGV